ncbi:unnamed protein product [Gongylonema pulchrum]|uniref:Uncharacterized protein n=1 Tax=Gongylonema pulchrum TaxID=637853 RepID=A0A3P6QBL3_9BILA|nr:unnamed protein product [Gongylonema pulchrum]
MILFSGKRDERRREKKRAKRNRQKERKEKKKASKAKKTKSSGADKLDEEEVEEAIKKVQKDWDEAEESIKLGDRKRRYHAHYDVNAPTEAEMEAYKRTRIHASDPMAAYMNEKRRKKPSEKD